jgi:pre-60S factor REI1
MQKHHSFFIPHLSSLTSLPTFLSYLATLVHTYHECLHCGAVRGSREAVQMHMRARGHCRLDFAKESELWAFWEEDVPCSLPGKAPTGELELLSAGTGRTRARDAAKKARMARMERALLQSRPEQDIPSVGPPEVPSASPHQASGPLLRAQDARNAPDPTSLAPRQLSRRTEQGMLGIPLQQRRTLMAVAKQAQQSAQVRANAEAWGRERCANKQKYYRAAGPMRPNG